MSEPAGQRYRRFAALAVAVIVALAALGWIPTLRRAGSEALPALLAGCAVSLAAALVSGRVLYRADPWHRRLGAGASGTEATQTVAAALQAMGVRLLILVGLGAVVGLAGWVPLKPFLVWTAISYLALLPVETRFALIDVERSAG